MDSEATPPPIVPSRSPDAESIRDREHLNLLAVFHFIGAGFAFFGLGFLGLHFLLFHAVMASGSFDGPFHRGMALPFGLFAIFYGFFALWFLTSLVLNILSGCFLFQRRHRLYSIIVGALNCLHVPFGTILGVFTILVLARDSIRREYPRRF